MNDVNTGEFEKVAQAYEQLLVPALFGEWAPRVAEAAGLRPGWQVLDVGCGTGVLARAAAGCVAPGGSVSGVDANPAMLAVAARIAPDIDWREGAAEALPFQDEMFDAVVSQFGLMLFAAPEAALREMVRVLKTGGRLAVAVFDSIDTLPAYAAMADLYGRLIDRAIGDALRMPFSMGDTAALAELFAAAGIGSPEIRSYDGTAHFSDTRHMVLADVQGWFPFAGFRLDEQAIEAVEREAEKVLEPFRVSDGSVEFRVPVHVITATKQ